MFIFQSLPFSFYVNQLTFMYIIVKATIYTNHIKTLVSRKSFCSKIFPYIFHVKPLFFKFNEVISYYLIFLNKSRCRLFPHFLRIVCIFVCKHIYDINKNVNFRSHNFLWLHSNIWQKKTKWSFMFKSYL